MPVEDYYSFIGVSAEADRDAIKNAYRARRAELDDSEAGRSNAAKLNRAWNVLSDSQQRERYDDDLATARADDDVIIPEIVTGATSANDRPRTKAQQRRDAARSGGKNAKGNNANRPPRQPINQLNEINGIPLAQSRDRVFALVTDVFVAFLVLFVAANVMTLKLVDSDIPQVVQQVKQIDKQTADQKKVADLADKTASSTSKDLADAKKDGSAGTITTATKANNSAQADKKKARAKFDQLTKDSLKLQEKYTPYYKKSIAAMGLLLFLIMVIPTALTGRSPGKALRKLRLVNADGSPAGWAGAVRHYGLVIGFLVATGIVLGGLSQIAWIIALFGCSSFTRSPTRQGWHDRIAKTFVVQA